ncbi:MAG: hypothetical protein ACERIH_04655 [Labilibaculum antarcticum]
MKQGGGFEDYNTLVDGTWFSISDLKRDGHQTFSGPNALNDAMTAIQPRKKYGNPVVTVDYVICNRVTYSEESPSSTNTSSSGGNITLGLGYIAAIYNTMRPVAYSVELNGSAEAGVASSASWYGGILVTRGPDVLKYRSFASVGIGAGVLGVSGQIVGMKYFYVGDINHFNLSVFSGQSWDAEISAGEGLIGGATISIMRNSEYTNEFLIGIGGFMGGGVGSPISGSSTIQTTVFF